MKIHATIADGPLKANRIKALPWPCCSFFDSTASCRAAPIRQHDDCSTNARFCGVDHARVDHHGAPTRGPGRILRPQKHDRVLAERFELVFWQQGARRRAKEPARHLGRGCP